MPDRPGLLRHAHAAHAGRPAAGGGGGNPANALSVYGFDFARLPADGATAQAEVDATCRLMCPRSAEAVVTHAMQVSAFDLLWLALLFACAAVLLAVGLAGTALGRHTLAADMLGYVASMTYDNRYVPLPGAGGGVLSAMERARVMPELRVCVNDVRGAWPSPPLPTCAGSR